ncbi:phosphoglycolate phosphatase [Lachnospiraceae bacterium C7]|nr:phosphoglycolate phosphatase [Lachnospiraceae bacterium C7]
MKKIAVLFPGIGYHCDKPLLYFAGKFFKEAGYEVVQLKFSGFPINVKGNEEKMKQSFEIVKKQTMETLNIINFDAYDKIVFVSKSIGTVAAAWYEKTLNKNKQQNEKTYTHISQIYMTPLAETYKYVTSENGIIFTGTKDPWVEHEEILRLTKEAKLDKVVIEEANHSLETKDVLKNIEILSEVVKKIEKYR